MVIIPRLEVIKLKNGMEFEKHAPIVYEIYDCLKTYAVGYDNRIKGRELMVEFNIKDNKTLRAYIEEIRDSETLQKLIGSEAGSNGGYWICTNQEEVFSTLTHLYKRSMKMLNTYSKIKNKANLNNQFRLKLNKYESELFNSLMEQ